MPRILELVYNFVLGGFSVYGAFLLGRWLLGRGWHWVFKAVALIMTAACAVSGITLMLGGAPDDLRILTEILATAGSIVAAVGIMSHRGARRSPWVQYGVPIALLGFLAFTWREQIQDIRHGGLTTSPAVIPGTATPAAPGSTTSVPSTAPTTTSGRSLKDLCAANQVDYQTCSSAGYK